MSKRTRTIIIVIIAVIIFVIAVSPRLGLFKAETKAAQAQIDPRVPVTALVVTPAPFENKINSTGTILANEEIELRSEIVGQITRIFFTEGTRVKKGNLLVKINDDELKAQLLKQVSQKKLAEDIVRRRKQLAENNYISTEEYERAENDFRAIDAEIKLIKAKIDKTELRAPFDGEIGLRYVSEGSFVNSSTRIANLQSLTWVKIDFSIPEKYAAIISKGSPITFAVAGSDAQFTGTIYAVEPKIDPVTRTVQIRARSENTRGKLVPGAFAQVQLLLETIPDAIMIPSEAVIPELQGQKVFVAVDGKAHAKKVTTGLRTDKLVQVTSGLSAGDTVITTGVMQLRPGMPVNVVVK